MMTHVTKVEVRKVLSILTSLNCSIVWNKCALRLGFVNGKMLRGLANWDYCITMQVKKHIMKLKRKVK